MRYIRRAKDRGQADFGWLNSRHSFSFGNYYDPSHMGISALRVINDDTVVGGAGFDTHGHRDMEIISYVMEGAIQHEDSLGNTFLLPVGEVQRMSAGSGVLHSEYNAYKDQKLRFLQIWIQPNVRGIAPEYEQKNIEQKDNLTPLVTQDGREGSLSIHQDASLYRLVLEPEQTVTLNIDNRTGYLHVISGQADAANCKLEQADGFGISDIANMTVTAGDETLEALWFDLPKVVA